METFYYSKHLLFFFISFSITCKLYQIYIFFLFLVWNSTCSCNIFNHQHTWLKDQVDSQHGFHFASLSIPLNGSVTLSNHSPNQKQHSHWWVSHSRSQHLPMAGFITFWWLCLWVPPTWGHSWSLHALHLVCQDSRQNHSMVCQQRPACTKGLKSGAHCWWWVDD